jgi:hypothetical protein
MLLDLSIRRRLLAVLVLCASDRQHQHSGSDRDYHGGSEIAHGSSPGSRRTASARVSTSGNDACGDDSDIL